MLKLPKVIKGVRRSMTRLDAAKSVIAGVALATGVALSGIPASDAQAATMQSVQPSNPGALLLVPGGQPLSMTFDHESHASHASHDSHASHHSHYSSRY